MDALEVLTRAVLYEGYLLWPYRPSALKNRRRWTLGGVYPEAWSRIHPDDPSRVRAECLVEVEGQAKTRTRSSSSGSRMARAGTEPWTARAGAGPPPPAAAVRVRVRFLRAADDAQRVVEEDISFGPFSLRDGGELDPSVFSAPGCAAGKGLEGELRVTVVAPEGGRPARISAEVTNRTPGGDGPEREDAARLALLSLHLVLEADRGGFVSLTEPPDELREDASRTRNIGLWPVLVGEPGERRTMLAAPIILPDYPRVAPESEGDLFDSTEIDQMLLLNVLALTDAERDEMRTGDPRARQILERALALDPRRMRGVNGTFRNVRVAGDGAHPLSGDGAAGEE